MNLMKLPVRLTESELVERGQRLVALRDQLDAAERTLAHAKAENKRAVEGVEEEQLQVLTQLREQAEWREVGVELQTDYEERVERIIRLDTGEIVRTRPLDPSELQGELIPVEAPERKRSPRRRGEEGEARG